MRPPVTAGTPPHPRHSIGPPSAPAPSPQHARRAARFDMPLSHVPQPVAMASEMPPSFSSVSADYAVPRAILAPRLSHLPPPPPPPPQSHAPFPSRHPLLPPRLQQQQQQPQLRRHLPPINNPSVLHPVFFTSNFQRRQSFGQPAPNPSTLHPAFMSAQLPPAPPAPPLPHASSPVAHGYVYREAPPQPMPHRTGTSSKL